MEYLISICIPAYRRTAFLKRLLDSLVIQRWKNFEVVITDDSPDEQVRDLCLPYMSGLALSYSKNPIALGTPQNWNEAIRLAKAPWIKLMHDDDWFADENSLGSFVTALQQNPEASFIFSAYRNVEPDGRQGPSVLLSPFWYRQLKHNAAVLFSHNVIGPPSVVLFKRRDSLEFDARLKWVVDFDFYIRYLAANKPLYIPKPLVLIGISESQVTRDSFMNPQVEVPENLLLLLKTGEGQLKNIFVFDAFWRLVRNLGLRGEADIRQAGYRGAIPAPIAAMMRFQKSIPASLKRWGPASKFLMVLCYIFCRAAMMQPKSFS